MGTELNVHYYGCSVIAIQSCNSSSLHFRLASTQCQKPFARHSGDTTVHCCDLKELMILYCVVPSPWSAAVSSTNTAATFAILKINSTLKLYVTVENHLTWWINDKRRVDRHNRYMTLEPISNAAWSEQRCTYHTVVLIAMRSFLLLASVAIHVMLHASIMGHIEPLRNSGNFETARMPVLTACSQLS